MSGTEKPGGPGRGQEEFVTLAKPGGEKDVTLFAAAGPIRFLEGRAHGVPLSVALELAGPGWSIEPRANLKEPETKKRA